MGQYSAGELLQIGQEPVIAAVVGCLGKTTFIDSVARAYPKKRVLLTPTAKILAKMDHDIRLCTNLAAVKAHRPSPGIQCFGILDEQTQKCSALPEKLLREIVGAYDLPLMEADGSRGLPCKGWAAFEPVIPDFCTHTVGIVTLLGLFRPVSEDTVLRIPEFTALTGLQPGDIITEEALLDMVCGEGGMFREAAGKRCLFFSQVEDAAAEETARRLLTQIGKRMAFNLLAYGSARRDSWKEVQIR